MTHQMESYVTYCNDNLDTKNAYDWKQEVNNVGPYDE